jgi:hypothetical protein
MTALGVDDDLADPTIEIVVEPQLSSPMGQAAGDVALVIGGDRRRAC